MSSKRSVFKEILHFIIHLRWHYQVFILSGGFLLGAFLNASMNWGEFMLQFINVHLLLFGGATAYNSFWDKDEGPVGGLKHPPKMSNWMWSTSLFLQFTGLAIAFYSGLLFAAIYLSSMLLFWLYSTPLFRWKGAPLKSLVAIGISTGTNSVLMGYLAAGANALNINIFVAALGVMLMILSLYPVSQLYQLDDDQRRGDRTFAISFGFAGVIQFFGAAFGSGLLLVALAMMKVELWLGIGFLFLGIDIGIWVYSQLKKLTTEQKDYHTVMRIKYGTSLAFVVFLIFIIFIKYTGIVLL